MSLLRRALPFAFVVALAGCITDPVTGESRLGIPTSDEEEMQMGEQYHPVVMQEFSGAYPDPDVQDYLARIVVGMAENGARPELDWRFTMLNSPIPNAFAVPGGEVYITRGLLAVLDDEAEFAMVMGHEIGHVEHRHTVQQMGRDSLINLLGALGGEAIGSPEIGGVAAALLTTKFSRDQERESDVRGVDNAYRAGYDPRQGADVFRKFLEMKQAQGGGGGLEWFSTHPLDSERIDEVLRLSAEIDPRLRGDRPVEGLIVQTRKFEDLIRRLRSEQSVYDRHDAALARAGQGGSDALRSAIPALESCARDLPRHAYFANTLGKAYLQLGENGRAREWFERAASLRQGLVEPELGLGLLANAAQRYPEAISHAEAALGLLPDNYLSYSIRGEALVGMGRTDAAQADFQRVMQTAPPESREYQAAAARLGVQPGEPTDRPRRRRR